VRRARLDGALRRRLSATRAGGAREPLDAGAHILPQERDAALSSRLQRRLAMAKGQEKVKKDNKPKLSTKEKQQKKKEKKASK
jgi:hypothetical protein